MARDPCSRHFLGGGTVCFCEVGFPTVLTAHHGGSNDLPDADSAMCLPKMRNGIELWPDEGKEGWSIKFDRVSSGPGRGYRRSPEPQALHTPLSRGFAGLCFLCCAVRSTVLCNLHCTALRCSCPVWSCWADGICFGATIHKLSDMGRRYRA